MNDSLVVPHKIFAIAGPVENTIGRNTTNVNFIGNYK